MSNKSMSFAEFLFSTDIKRDPEDTVAKLARKFKADMGWDIHMVTKVEIEVHVVRDLVTTTMARFKADLEGIVRGEGVPDLEELLNKFQSGLGSSRMAVNVAWNDYQAYLNSE